MECFGQYFGLKDNYNLQKLKNIKKIKKIKFTVLI
jgi:hypothetical protein